MGLSKTEKLRLKQHLDTDDIEKLDRQAPGATFQICNRLVNQNRRMEYERGYHKAIEDMKLIVQKKEENQ